MKIPFPTVRFDTNTEESLPQQTRGAQPKPALTDQPFCDWFHLQSSFPVQQSVHPCQRQQAAAAFAEEKQFRIGLFYYNTSVTDALTSAETLLGPEDYGFLGKPKKPHVVASLIGRIEAVLSDRASVLLVNEATGESQESHCDLEVLQDNSLSQGDEFRLEVLRIGGTAMTRILPLAPKPIGTAELEEFRKSYENRWNPPR